MTPRHPNLLTEIVLEALERSFQRGILLSGWGGIGNVKKPDSVFVIDSVPHDWLFPQMAAVVHHGGTSTTAAGLRAGVPSIITPFFGDQFFWGERVVDLAEIDGSFGEFKVKQHHLFAFPEFIRLGARYELMRFPSPA